MLDSQKVHISVFASNHHKKDRRLDRGQSHLEKIKQSNFDGDSNERVLVFNLEGIEQIRHIVTLYSSKAAPK